MRGAERSLSPREAVNRGFRTRPKKEIARLGREIYDRDIRKQVEAGHVGEIVCLDVETGSWAMADELLEAADRLRDECPGAVNVCIERVGYVAVGGFGGAPPRRTD